MKRVASKSSVINTTPKQKCKSGRKVSPQAIYMFANTPITKTEYNTLIKVLSTVGDNDFNEFLKKYKNKQKTVTFPPVLK